jgi:hypothetical protein
MKLGGKAKEIGKREVFKSDVEMKKIKTKKNISSNKKNVCLK